jgi:hypothetical protein
MMWMPMMSRNSRISRLALLGLVGLTVSCDDLRQQGAAEASATQPVHVDSVFPLDEEIRRFRAELQDSVASLAGGAGSLDALVAAFAGALQDRDVVSLGKLVITPAEFAYLYYPATRYTRRPYEMSPSLVWFQLENYGSRGLNRALARYGGRPLRVIGHACPHEAAEEGGNRVWHGCVVRRIDEAGDTVNTSLFGAILERDDRFKFINYANRL